MSRRDLVKGNEAIAYGALRAGLNAYFAYPITPSSEIPETLAAEFGNPEFPEFRAFLQASSEIESINMLIGAASAGAKAMTATSGPGFSLKQEGLSYAAAMEVPLLVVDVNRAGPGLGNLGPEQSDYTQAKGGGHGGHRNIVLAPNSVQEMATFPQLGFRLAFRYRNPVVILADAFIGQLKEDIVFPEVAPESYDTSWAATGSAGRERHLILSLHLDSNEQRRHTELLMKKYQDVATNERRAETYMTEDASVVLIAYGIMSRMCREAIHTLRSMGVKAGMFRPVTLFPFPDRELFTIAGHVAKFLVVELNGGQMIQDVRLAVRGLSEIHFLNGLGGMMPEPSEIASRTVKLANG